MFSIDKISRKNKKRILLSFLGVLIFMALCEPAWAQSVQEEGSALGSFLSKSSNAVGAVASFVLAAVAYVFNAVAGLFITLMIQILINVASFSNIIDVPTVQTGWVIVRDLCNMFIVLILLFIAFATILRLENYSFNKLLPKLLIVAILINFSRTIFGLIIDFSQIIMLSFVHSFDSGHGWFINVFNTQHIMGINTDASWAKDPFTQWETVVAIIAGMFAAVVTLIVVVVLTAVLIIRVVMLWIYTILSPLIFLGFAFPPVQKYIGSMWENFIKQVIVGPLLAFFIWLALKTVKDSATKLGGSTNELTIAQSAFFGDADFQRFLIAIALMIGGLIATQHIGGAAGQAAGKGMAAVKKSGLKGARIGQKGAQKAGSAAGRGALTGGRFLDKTAGRGADALSRGLTGGKDWGLREKGVAGGAAVGAWNAPASLYNKIATEVRKNEDHTQKRYDATREYERREREEGEGYVERGGKIYDKTDEDKFQERGGEEMLKDDEGNEIKAMTGRGKAWYEARKDTYSRPRAAEESAEKKELDEKTSTYKDYGAEDRRRIYNDSTKNIKERKAAAMAQAQEGDVADHDEFKKLKELTQDNSLVQKEIKDKIYEKQPHLVHDLRPDKDGNISQTELEKFKKDVDKGKISLANAPAAAKKNLDFTRAMQESLDTDAFKKQMNKAFESMGKKGKDAIESNLNKIKNEKKVGSDEWKKNANLHADLTGKVQDSFSDQNGENLQHDQMGEWFSNANANKLDNLDHGQVKKLIEDDKAQEKIINNIKYSQLKSWNRKQDKNTEVFKELRDRKLAAGGQESDKISNDPEMS